MSATTGMTPQGGTAGAGRVYLVVPGLAEQVQTLAAQFAVQSARAAVILAQPDLGLSIVSTLPSDQALLRQHVNQFCNSMALSGGMMAALQAVVTISNQFVNTGDALVPVARALDAGTPGTASYDSSLSNFRDQLAQLSAVTTSLNPDLGSPALAIKEAQTALESFVNAQIGDDIARFETAVKQAKFSGNLADLELKVDALRTQMGSVNNSIAHGAAAQVDAALKYGFSLSETLVSASTNPGELVLVGAFVLANAVEKGNAFVEEIDQWNDTLNGLIAEYRDLIESLVETEQEMSVLLTIAAQCQTFGASVSVAVEALRNMLLQLALLDDGIDALTTIDSSDQPGFFTGQINQAISAWQAMADNCTSLLTLARTLNSAG